jgi:membrane protein YdbS with pleckstrin-like domain
MTTSFFENEQLNVHSLPSVENLIFQPLEKDYLKVSMIAASIFSLIFIVAASVLIYILGEDSPFLLRVSIGIGALVLASLVLWLTYMGFHFKKYALRQKDIVFQSGYVFRSQTVVPFNRIQHCEINQGPIDRIFDLSSLKIFTAGGSYSDLSIPGLQKFTAEDLKHFIIKQTGIGEEE